MMQCSALHQKTGALAVEASDAPRGSSDAGLIMEHPLTAGATMDLPEDLQQLSLAFFWETKDGPEHASLDADASCLLFNAKGVCTGTFK